MYIAIIRHHHPRGVKKGLITYDFVLSACKGGLVWARSNRYYTVDMVMRVAADLFMGNPPWSEERPEPDPCRYDCHLTVEPLPMERKAGKAASEGEPASDSPSLPPTTPGEPNA